MPVITLHGCDTQRQIQFIDITCRVRLSDNCTLQKAKLAVLERKLSSVLMEFYDAIDSEIFTDEAFDKLLTP